MFILVLGVTVNVFDLLIACFTFLVDFLGLVFLCLSLKSDSLNLGNFFVFILRNLFAGDVDRLFDFDKILEELEFSTVSSFTQSLKFSDSFFCASVESNFWLVLLMAILL